MTGMEILPIILYVLGIILLVVLIVLGIKMILFIDKADKLVTDVQDKVSSFDSIFRVMDFASEKLTVGITSVIDSFVKLIKKLFKKRKEEEEYYE